MSSIERIEKLEIQTKGPVSNETIIPAYQTPDTCVFCTSENYDVIFYGVYRLAYNYKTKKDYGKQDKKTCIHHKDSWLKHSLRSADYVWAAMQNQGYKPIIHDKVLELFKNKEEREKLLNVEYDNTKNFSSATYLYLPKSSGVDYEGRYTDGFTLEDDVEIQTKIIQGKIKIYYEKALEVLKNFD